jgi:acyl-CoA thioester hydrolase
MPTTLISSRVATAHVRVRYAETDKMGVVYYANYLVWFEVARCEWFRGTGSTYQDLEAAGTVLPVVEAHCEYERPARYDDEIEIRTGAQLLSPVRLRFDYELFRRGDATPLAAGYTVHAAVDPTGRLRRLPPDVRTLFR